MSAPHYTRQEVDDILARPEKFKQWLEGSTDTYVGCTCNPVFCPIAIWISGRLNELRGGNVMVGIGNTVSWSVVLPNGDADDGEEADMPQWAHDVEAVIDQFGYRRYEQEYGRPFPNSEKCPEYDLYADDVLPILQKACSQLFREE